MADNLNLHPRARIIPSSIFIVLSAISATFIVLSAVNYSGYYPALANITSSVTSITFVNASSGKSLLANVHVDNPRSYSGLKVATIFLSTCFALSNSSNCSVFTTLPIQGTETYLSPLPPHTTVSLSVSLPLDSKESSQLSSSYIASSGKVTARCDLDVKISTFLDEAFGYYDAGSLMQSVPLSATTPS